MIYLIREKGNKSIMRNIQISDVTMRQPVDAGGFSLSFREKIELAKLLDRAGVDLVETGPIVNRRTDSLLVKSIASAVSESAVATPLTLEDADTVEITWNALREAVRPRLQVVAPVSTVQMEYLCHRKPAALVERVRELIAAARAVCADVEFVAEDAGRSEENFLKEILTAAMDAGATTVTICDTAGTLLPDEFQKAVAAVRAYVPEPIHLGVRCSGELGIPDACAMAAILGGADEVKTTACGDFTAGLQKLVHILKLKGSENGVACSVRDTELGRTVNQIRWMCETERRKGSPFDNGVRDAQEDIALTVHDDLGAVLKAAARLGYDLDEEDGPRVYEAFTRIAMKKEQVGARELDAIIASAALQVPPTYRVERYVFNSGNVIKATCQMVLTRGEQLLEGLGAGDGPVDAAILAIEQIVGRHYELDDFQIQAVTEGREAMGETVVRLRAGGKLYSGRGISTDVIGSAIRAYVNAVNKIVYEEGEAQ